MLISDNYTCNKHPPLLWVLSIIYATFTFAFGIFLTNLLLVLDKGYSGLTQDQAFNLFAAFYSLAFTLPVLGGFICDKYGFRYSAIVGLYFSGVGILVLLIPGFSFLLIGLSLFLIGNALCTPAIWSLVGMLYDKKHTKRESGSTIFYVLFNTGFLLSQLTSSFMLKNLGKEGLIIYAIPVLLSAIFMSCFHHKMYTYKEHDAGKILAKGKSNYYSIIIIFLISIFFIPICYLLLRFYFINDILLWLFLFVAFGYIIYLSIKLKDTQKSNNLVAFMILCLIAFGYLIIFNSEFGLLPVYAENNLNRVVAGINFPAGSITSLDSAYCIILGFAYSFIWDYLSKKNKNPSLPTKFSLGLILASIGYLILALLVFTNINIEFSALWLLLVFFFFASGELMVMPIGIAMTGSLAPEGKEGLLMGVWNMIAGSSAVLVGFIASATSLPKNTPLLISNTRYMDVFFIIGIIVLLVGIFIFCIKGLIKKLL